MQGKPLNAIKAAEEKVLAYPLFKAVFDSLGVQPKGQGDLFSMENLRFERIVLVYSARTAGELAYQDLIRELPGRDYLEGAGFIVISAGDGHSALTQARRERPDLVILDLNLPRLDGLDVARELRRESSVPIIMLTARSEEADRLIGLELGADDYISKPFSPRELVARVRAVLRRVKGDVRQAGVIRALDLEIDLRGNRVSRGGQPLHLTRTEFTLLAMLAQSPGQTFTREQMIDRLHGVVYAGYDRSIDSHVKNIRRKIEADPLNPTYVLTVYGIGYKFTDDEG